MPIPKYTKATAPGHDHDKKKYKQRQKRAKVTKVTSRQHEIREAKNIIRLQQLKTPHSLNHSQYLICSTVIPKLASISPHKPHSNLRQILPMNLSSVLKQIVTPCKPLLTNAWTTPEETTEPCLLNLQPNIRMERSAVAVEIVSCVKGRLAIVMTKAENFE